VPAPRHPPTLEERHAKAEEDLKKWDWISHQPDLSSRAVMFSREMVHAARARLELGWKAIDYRDRLRSGRLTSEEAADRQREAMSASLLRIPLPPET
jgi:hypothetical protein